MYPGAESSLAIEICLKLPVRRKEGVRDLDLILEKPRCRTSTCGSFFERTQFREGRITVTHNHRPAILHLADIGEQAGLELMNIDGGHAARPKPGQVVGQVPAIASSRLSAPKKSAGRFQPALRDGVALGGAGSLRLRRNRRLVQPGLFLPSRLCGSSSRGLCHRLRRTWR